MASPAGTCRPTGTMAALLQALSRMETLPSHSPGCGYLLDREDLPSSQQLLGGPWRTPHGAPALGSPTALGSPDAPRSLLPGSCQRDKGFKQPWITGLRLAVPGGTWNFSLPSLKSRSWCCRCRLSPYKCPRSTCQESTESRLLRKALCTPVPLLAPHAPHAALSSALTPCPSALVKPRPIFPDVLKNWWVKCWAKKANIRLVPRGSASNFCRSRNLSARSWGSGSCCFPVKDGG